MRHLWILASVGAIALSIAGCTPEKPSTNSNASMGASDTTMLEADAKDAISSMLFDEKTRFLAKKTFSIEQANLKSGAFPQNKSYSYQVASISDASKEKNAGIVITATSKQPGFRSFTGVVFALESTAGSTTVSQICETVSPSQLAPKVPAMPKQPSEKIRCPEGSRSSLELAALQ
jgi:hypothetical protein